MTGMNTPMFTPGVRVRVRAPENDFFGQCGTVGKVTDPRAMETWPVWVQLDGMPTKLGFTEDEIELLSLENLVEFFSQQLTVYVEHVPGIRAALAARMALDDKESS